MSEKQLTVCITVTADEKTAYNYTTTMSERELDLFKHYGIMKNIELIFLIYKNRLRKADEARTYEVPF